MFHPEEVSLRGWRGVGGGSGSINSIPTEVPPGVRRPETRFKNDNMLHMYSNVKMLRFTMYLCPLPTLPVHRKLCLLRARRSVRSVERSELVRELEDADGTEWRTDISAAGVGS